MKHGVLLAALGLSCTLLAGQARAVEVRSIEVTRADTRYHVRMDVRLDVPATAAYAVFADLSLLPRINPAVRVARALDERVAAGLRRVYTDVRVCVSFFCRRLEQVQDMRFTSRGDGGDVSAQVIPERSDLRYGRANWTLRDCAGRTCLGFDAELEPRFWVPPLIGPWLVQRKLREEAMQTSAGIERLARGAAP